METDPHPCPVCGLEVTASATECPNCGAVVEALFASAVVMPPEPKTQPVQMHQPARPLRAKKTHLSAIKFRQRSLQQRDIFQSLTQAQTFLRENNPARALESYRQAAARLGRRKRSGLPALALDILIQNVHRLAEVPTPAAPPRAAVWPLAMTILFSLLAVCGLTVGWGVWTLTQFGAAPYSPPTVTGTATSSVSRAPTFTPTPFLTPTATPLPETSPLGSQNLETVTDLFSWKAGEDITGLAFSADGQRLASSDSDGMVTLWPLWQEIPLKQFPGRRAAFSPDGRWLAVGGDAGLTLYNAADGSLARVLDGVHYYHSVLFSPDSQVVAAGADNSKFYLWNVNDGSEQKASGGFIRPVHSLSFSSDGHLLGVASNELVYVWNLQGQKIERGIPHFGTETIYFSAALSPDGQWFATGLKNGQIYIWRISNSERMAAFNDKSRFVTGLQFLQTTQSPALLVSADEVNLSFWQMYGYETSLRRSIYVSVPIHSLAVAPGDRLIATGGQDGVIHLWGVLP